MYIAHPTHGARTRPSRTQPPTAARKTTLNAGQCVPQPRGGRGRNRQPPPPERRKRGGRGEGGRENSPQPPNRPPTPQEAAKPPTQKAPKTAPQKRHRGTTEPKPATPSQEQRPTGKRDIETCRHTPRWKKKKEPAAQPERKGMGGQGPQGPGQGQPATDTTKPNQDTPKEKCAKSTPQQRNQEGRGTAETRAQHARPHTAPRPGKAGNKRGARTNTHHRTATPTRRCRRPRGTGARAHTHPNTPPRGGGAQPKLKPQHARPHRTPEPETAGGKRGAHATTHVP